MKKRIAVVTVLTLLVAAATASAINVHVVIGNLVLDAHGDYAPKALPKHENAPITTEGGGKLSTLTGELPPILDKFVLEFDKHGALDTTGLPVCTKGKLVATDVPTARKACGPATVGEGFGAVVVKFPEQAPIKVGAPITLFNGPKKGGDDTIIAHTYLANPVSATFIVPKIAGGYGHPLEGSAKVGKKWTYKGKKHSYINARCETGHFVVHGAFSFKGGPEETAAQAEEAKTILNATFLLPCKVRN
jgi:hypothetical protein